LVFQMKLYSRPLMAPPEGLITRPHNYQLKGANQMKWACYKSPAKGLLVGDGMGLGKTLQTILFIHSIKSRKGFAVVVVTYSNRATWECEFRKHFDPVSTPPWRTSNPANKGHRNTGFESNFSIIRT
jgi:SNF2 family DNA or RNA helicase